jgi:hypothetical protein
VSAINVATVIDLITRPSSVVRRQASLCWSGINIASTASKISAEQDFMTALWGALLVDIHTNGNKRARSMADQPQIAATFDQLTGLRLQSPTLERLWQQAYEEQRDWRRQHKTWLDSTAAHGHDLRLETGEGPATFTVNIAHSALKAFVPPLRLPHRPVPEVSARLRPR